MSRPTTVISAAAAIAAGLVTVSAQAPAAQAAPGDCLDWAFNGATAINVTGNFIPPDDNGFNLTFVANGKNVNNPATMDSVPIVGSVHGNMTGNINGTGITLSFTSDQQNPVTIPLNGNVGPDGIARGTTGGQYAGGNWTSGQLHCTKKEEEAPKPKSQPTVTSDTVLGGLVIHVKNNTADTTACHYDSEVVDRDFTLTPNATTDLRIVPAVPLLRNWNYSVTCDNDTSTTGTIFF
jgi:hypothetical protein